MNEHTVKSIDELKQKALSSKKKVIVVAAAEDENVLEAIKETIHLGLANAILVGDIGKIESISDKIHFDLKKVTIIDRKIPKKSAEIAVNLIRMHDADMLMKGMINTSELLKVILDKEKGLRTGKILSLTSVFELPTYHKLLILTDAGVNLLPDVEEKIQILENAVQVCHVLGIQSPKVAILCAVEKVNPAMKATMDAAILSKMADRGQLKGMLIDGPLSMDVAISLEAAKKKGISSPVAGDPDLLLVPNIEAGNILYKSLVYLGNARNAGVVLGAKVPIIMTSRADSAEAKLNSIALGLLISDQQKKDWNEK
jgi:phosphate butyryltransferase